jgi:TetR/AcrR family transcriptional regulator, cholesterol catabolism regulator
LSQVKKVASKREQKKVDKRERIRKAAWQLFTTRGFAATTTKEVAERAGIATGTLFLYAKDKRDLLFLVFHDRLRETIDARFAGMPRGKPLLEQWMHVFRGLFALYGAEPEIAAEFLRAFPGGSGPNTDALNALTFAFMHRMAGLVREAQARGEVASDVEPLQAATNVFALYYGALVAWLLGFSSLEAALEPGLRRALALQLRGLEPRRQA